jgi:glucose-6-phosphate isomerase
MIGLDYSYSSVVIDDLKKYENRIRAIVSNFKNKNCEGNEYIGWYDFPNNISAEEISTIEKVANEIKESSEVFVVCGIGGSYLGARAVIEAVKGFYKTDMEIVYLGNTFDEKYIKDTLEYLRGKDFCVNVISKSGTTLETAVAFRLLKDLLVEKYGAQACKKIYVTTDECDGCLRKSAEKENYCSFVIPKDIGGRYSVFTPVGLLPLAVAGVNINEFVEGAKRAFKDFQDDSIEKNIAYQYAAYRFHQYSKSDKKVELFVSYSPYLNMISEWWKQLFGESEGKGEKGLFPASVNFSTDLHSLGQFVQQGSKILFMTQVKITENGNLYIKEESDNADGLNYLRDISVQEINKKAQTGTNKAHYAQGSVDNLTFVIEKIEPAVIGYLLYFLMCSCMISAYLLGVNPFDQPGVEFYKCEMKKLLKKE